MRTASTRWIALGSPPLASLAAATGAWAQGGQPTTPPPLPPSANSGWADMTVIVFFGVALLVVLGVVVKLIDVRRKRNEEAMFLQARIGDAWLQSSALAMLPIAATARVPLRRTLLTTIELTGRVPTTALRDSAVDVATQVAERNGVDARIEDHIVVERERAARVA